MTFKAKIEASEIERLSVAEFGGEICVIDHISEEYFKAVEYLKKQKILGFDTETKPTFTANERRNRVALLQLSGADKAFIFRLIKLGIPDELAKILSNARIKKVGAAVHDDIKGLQHYKQFVAKGFVDLQKIGKDYGIEEKSVRKMAGIILNLRVSKSQQLSNWESNELSHGQIQYAAIDAWACREMYVKLIAEKAKVEENPKAKVEEKPNTKAKAKQKETICQ